MRRLPLTAEVREGYARASFKHWNSGRIPDDGCNTRAEVLFPEAVEPPTVLPPLRTVGRALVVVR